jgi:hypothetical protein
MDDSYMLAADFRPRHMRGIEGEHSNVQKGRSISIGSSAARKETLCIFPFYRFDLNMDFQLKDNSAVKAFIIPPHVVVAEQQVIQTTPPEHFDDILFWIYSSVDDIATFLTVLIDPSTKERNGFDRMKFFAPTIVAMSEDEDIKYSNFGFCLPLDKIGQDFTSLNAIVSPSAGYSLGPRQVQSEKEQNLSAYHMDRAVPGYTVDAYVLLETRSVIVCLGNATGRTVNASDHVCRAIIQKEFCFQDPQENEVNIPAMANVRVKEAELWFEYNYLSISPTMAGDLIEKCPGLNGLFTNEQSFHIVKKKDHYEFSVVGSGGQSEWLWLFPDQERDDSVWIRPQPSGDIATMGIDVQDSWFPLSFRAHKADRRIMTLTRESQYCTFVYTQVEK